MTFRYISGHLGDGVDLYVDGRLDDASARRAARHLLTCAPCRTDVDAERSIVQEVRSVHVDPDRHACLVAGLLSLTPPTAQTSPRRPVGPALVRPDAPARRNRLAKPLAAVAALVVGAGVLALSVHTAPPRPTPHVPGLANPAPSYTPAERSATARPGQMMRANSDASGRMGP